MNFPWALCIAREDAAALAAVRLVSRIELAEAGSQVWVRGPGTDDATGVLLEGLPATERFEWQPPDLLRRLDHRIPSGRLPKVRWQSLDSWLQIETPPAALPGTHPAGVALRLVRSGGEREADLLLTRIDEFRKFAIQAARVRLERLTFAAVPDGRVLVRGRPLPPVPGARFVLHDGVAVPAGFAWEPAVSPAVLSRRFGASPEALVLWDETFCRFHSEQFVPATRSAVLSTERALAEFP